MILPVHVDSVSDTLTSREIHRPMLDHSFSEAALENYFSRANAVIFAEHSPEVIESPFRDGVTQ